jgi:peroxiredoxin family protein
MYDVAAQLAVKIYACQMSMDLMGFKKEELIDYPDLEVCGVATMLLHAKESAIQFFI